MKREVQKIEIEIDGKRFLKLSEAARQLGKSDVTLRRWCQEELVPGAMKLGKAWWVPLEILSMDTPRMGRPPKENSDAG